MTHATRLDALTVISNAYGSLLGGQAVDATKPLEDWAFAHYRMLDDALDAAASKAALDFLVDLNSTIRRDANPTHAALTRAAHAVTIAAAEYGRIDSRANRGLLGLAIRTAMEIADRITAAEEAAQGLTLEQKFHELWIWEEQERRHGGGY